MASLPTIGWAGLPTVLADRIVEAVCQYPLAVETGAFRFLRSRRDSIGAVPHGTDAQLYRWQDIYRNRNNTRVLR